ncbi:6237_t:CDS:2, partial [Ambispora leptoticha]
MEAMMREFNERVEELKNCMLLRAEEDILVELRDSLSELETHVSYMTTFLQEEKLAIERAKEIKIKLKSQYEYLQRISQNLPKHLPGNNNDFFAESMLSLKSQQQRANITKIQYNLEECEDFSQAHNNYNHNQERILAQSA